MERATYLKLEKIADDAGSNSKPSSLPWGIGAGLLAYLFGVSPAVAAMLGLGTYFLHSYSSSDDQDGSGSDNSDKGLTKVNYPKELRSIKSTAEGPGAKPTQTVKVSYPKNLRSIQEPGDNKRNTASKSAVSEPKSDPRDLGRDWFIRRKLTDNEYLKYHTFGYTLNPVEREAMILDLIDMDRRANKEPTTVDSIAATPTGRNNSVDSSRGASTNKITNYRDIFK